MRELSKGDMDRLAEIIKQFTGGNAFCLIVSSSDLSKDVLDAKAKELPTGPGRGLIEMELGILNYNIFRDFVPKFIQAGLIQFQLEAAEKLGAIKPNMQAGAQSLLPPGNSAGPSVPPGSIPSPFF